MFDRGNMVEQVFFARLLFDSLSMVYEGQCGEISIFLADRQTTDGQTKRLFNPASHMRATRGVKIWLSLLFLKVVAMWEFLQPHIHVCTLYMYVHTDRLD